jgi:hypothetical protein
MANIFAIYSNITTNTVDMSVGNGTNKKIINVAAGTANNNALSYGQAGANVADLTVTNSITATAGPISIGAAPHATIGNLRIDATTAAGIISWSGPGGTASTIQVETNKKITISSAGGIVLGNSTVCNGNISAPYGNIATAMEFVSSSSGYDALLMGGAGGYLAWTAATGQTKTISITDSTVASTTGAVLDIHGQDCTGTTSVTAGNLISRAGDATGGSGTRNGGNWIARAGAGATTNGYLQLQSGTNSKSLKVSDVGVDIVGDVTADSLDTSAGTAPTGAGVGLLNATPVTWAGASAGSAELETDSNNDLAYASVAGHIHTIADNGYSGGFSDKGYIRVTGSDDTPFTFDIPTPDDTEGVITMAFNMRSINGSHSMTVGGASGYTNDAGVLVKQSDGGYQGDSGTPADGWTFSSAPSGGSLRVTLTGSAGVGTIWVTGSWTLEAGPYMGTA